MFLAKKQNIINDIGCSITRSCYDAINHDSNRNPSEPAIIARMTMHLAYDICNSLSVYASNYEVSVKTVFCHQRPIVEFNGKRCELGDILFVFDEKRGTITEGNTLLLQAKKTEGNTCTPDNATQQELYSTFPKFSYYRPALKDKNGVTISRDIMPKAPTHGARYLLLEKPYDSSILCVCADATPVGYEVSEQQKLAENLVGLLDFTAGRKYEPCNTQSNNDWSNMIHDLLETEKMKDGNSFAEGVILCREYGAMMNIARNGIKNIHRIREATFINNPIKTFSGNATGDGTNDEEISFVIFHITASDTSYREINNW